MYFARAAYVFKNNDWVPASKKGSHCLYRDFGLAGEMKTLFDPTIASLLDACGVPLAFYAEGYAEDMPSIIDPPACFPWHYDNSDVPFQYYAPLSDNSEVNRDYSQFWKDVNHGALPPVTFIKSIGMRTGHPGVGSYGGTITECQSFAK